MVDGRFHTKAVEQLRASYTEHDLLVDAHVLVAAVDPAADVAVVRLVCGNVCVEQIEGCTADFELPCLCEHFALGNIDGNDKVLAVGAGHFFNGKAFCILQRIVLHLPSILVEVLAEVALFVEQRDADEVDAEVTGRFDVVTGKDAEAS